MKKVFHDSEIPAKGQQVITACAFIHREFNSANEVFLAKRSQVKKFLPGVFELPGGHIDFGENIVDGLKREIKEEFNVEASVGDPFAVFTYENQIKGSHSIEVIYFAKFVDSDKKIKIDLEDHLEYGWFTQSEVSLMNAISAEEKKNIEKGFLLLNGGSCSFG